jgi:histidinol dehydrogenase
MSLVRLIRHTDADYPSSVAAIAERLHGGGLVSSGSGKLDVPGIVSGIIERVRTEGDRAAAELASRLDGAALGPADLLVDADSLRAAHERTDPGLLELMRAAIGNIREYQEHILVRAPEPLVRGGRRLGVRYTPLDRVGVYVPGGQALYPSSVLMTVVPAQVAGVREIAMFTPTKGGEIHPLALALAHELGISEVYRLGGAVAVAAAAFGTESITRVDKIVGPGNAFVAEAKRQLFGRVGIDSIAGPSEVLIVADDSADPRWTAADMLAQAEHNPGSAVLVTTSAQLAEATQEEVESQLARLDRAQATRHCIEEYSAIILTDTLAHACDIANSFATEHLQIVTRENEACLGRIRHAGAIFLGPFAPVPVGDYFAGPSHVLPTGGTAKFFGPLSCNDFIKSSSLIEYDRQGLLEDAPKIRDFAQHEGLTAHARAAMIRSE